MVEKAAYELIYEAATGRSGFRSRCRGFIGSPIESCQPKREPMHERTKQSPCVRPEIEALAEARHGDPFTVLGPHDTPTGRIVRTFLPGARAVEALRRADRAARSAS